MTVPMMFSFELFVIWLEGSYPSGNDEIGDECFERSIDVIMFPGTHIIIQRKMVNSMNLLPPDKQQLF